MLEISETVGWQAVWVLWLPFLECLGPALVWILDPFGFGNISTQKLWVLELFLFQIFGLGMLTYPVPSSALSSCAFTLEVNESEIKLKIHLSLTGCIFCFAFLWFYLLLIHIMSGIMPYLSFCGWLLLGSSL